MVNMKKEGLETPGLKILTKSDIISAFVRFTFKTFQIAEVFLYIYSACPREFISIKRP